MTLLVRRILAEEGELLRDVRLAALQDTPSAFGSSYADEAKRTPAEWADRARVSAEGTDRATFFAVADGHVVGLAGGYRPDPNGSEVHLVSMWTAPAARRAGAGRALVDAVIDWARASAATQLSLWVTRGNEAALALYETMGFRETGDAKPLPSDPCKDEIGMTRSV
jgi:ribosomal protein S18 acetylase RimI-like enzyme